ncbi:MAG: hypothetical protein GKR88_14780 [Flavobacteriaceae bacterium]|nr:MAG: hypothetical protein GKR88_14780 [Flavobacteriaceae bacterium]
MKKIALLVLIHITACYFAQRKSTKTGRATLAELNMKSYEKDSTARALVLYEHANLYMETKKYDFQTDFYFRKKIFTKEGTDVATVKVITYGKERIKDILAVTYNLRENGSVEKTYLQKKDIFKNQLNEKYTETSFTLPNVKEGSVIEYVYSLISPYPSLDDLYFQSDIPKLQSDYDSAIIGNYKYNARIIGNPRLTKDNPSVLKKCIYIEGIGQAACAVRSFSMTDIPAFKEEDYMLSKKNYISRVAFDYVSYTDLRGGVRHYLNDWAAADKSLKNDFLKNQSNKKNFFKKRLPESVLQISNPLEKAKAIYSYIQENYTWNGKKRSSKNNKMRAVFEEKSGSVYDINLVLYNSLQAAEIESYIAMVSTRNNGLPTKLYPIIADFNYLIV